MEPEQGASHLSSPPTPSTSASASSSGFQIYLTPPSEKKRRQRGIKGREDEEPHSPLILSSPISDPMKESDIFSQKLNDSVPGEEFFYGDDDEDGDDGGGSEGEEEFILSQEVVRNGEEEEEEEEDDDDDDEGEDLQDQIVDVAIQKEPTTAGSNFIAAATAAISSSKTAKATSSAASAPEKKKKKKREKNNSMSREKKSSKRKAPPPPPPTPPDAKLVPGTNFLVDGFQFKQQKFTHYLLTHFHSDHYVGLNKHFKFGKIYGTAITLALVQSQIGCSSDKLVTLELDKEFAIPEQNVRIVPMEANHCPGAAIFLFKVGQGESERRYLHCGDMRYHPSFKANETLRACVNRLHALYLDTTFCQAAFDFPPQSDAVQFVASECLRLRQLQEARFHASRRVKPGFQNQIRQATTTGVSAMPSSSTSVLIPSITGQSSGGSSSVLPLAAYLHLPLTAFELFRAPGALSVTPPGVYKTLVLIGSYTIGKEKVMLGVGRALSATLAVTQRKFNLLKQCLPAEDLAFFEPLLDARTGVTAAARPAKITPILAADGSAPPAPSPGSAGAAAVVSAQRNVDIRVCSMFDCSFKRMQEIFMAEKHEYFNIVAFRPTGWTASKRVGGNATSTGATGSSRTQVRSQTRGPLTLHMVPYSEHSSFPELKAFVGFLRPEKIVPTVNLEQSAAQVRMFDGLTNDLNNPSKMLRYLSASAKRPSFEDLPPPRTRVAKKTTTTKTSMTSGARASSLFNSKRKSSSSKDPAPKMRSVRAFFQPVKKIEAEEDDEELQRVLEASRREAETEGKKEDKQRPLSQSSRGTISSISIRESSLSSSSTSSSSRATTRASTFFSATGNSFPEVSGLIDSSEKRSIADNVFASEQRWLLNQAKRRSSNAKKK